MNFNTITRALAKAGHIISKHSPTILTVAGVAGGTAAAVLGAKAAVESIETRANLNEKLEQVQQQKDGYSRKEYSQLVFYTTVKHGTPVLKQFAPALIVGGLSITAVLWGHNILRGRYTASVAAFATLERSFNLYREKVREHHGEEADRKILEEMSAVEREDENGEPLWVHEQKLAHLYQRVFDDHNKEWSIDREYNMYFLKVQENIFNQQLQRNGYVFLNDVLKQLGFDEVPEGQLTGWLANGEEDGYIDFGLELINLPGRAFDMSMENKILLEFNVDGVIYDKI